MPKPRFTVGPTLDIERLAKAVQELQELVGSGISIGDTTPQFTLAKKSGRPRQEVGQADNIVGAIVEVELDNITQLNTNLEVYHGLMVAGMPSNVGGDQRLNVAWDIKRVRFGGSVAVTDTRVNVMYVDGVVEVDSIGLRFYTNLVPTSSNLLRLVLFLYPVGA